MNGVNDGGRRAVTALLAAAVLAAGCTSSPSESRSTAEPSSAPPASSPPTSPPTTVAAPATDAATTAPRSTSAATDLDVTRLDPLIVALAPSLRAGAGAITLGDVLRSSPRASVDGYEERDGAIIVAVPAGPGCAWFRPSPTGEIEFGGTADSCRSGSRLPALSATGAGEPWAADALSAIDELARLNATAVLDEFRRAVVNGSPPSVEALLATFPGLDLVDDSIAPASAAVTISGADIAIAVRGQSGRCSLIAASISSNSTVRYGTSDSTCTANDAVTSAQSPSW